MHLLEELHLLFDFNWLTFINIAYQKKKKKPFIDIMKFCLIIMSK